MESSPSTLPTGLGNAVSIRSSTASILTNRVSFCLQKEVTIGSLLPSSCSQPPTSSLKSNSTFPVSFSLFVFLFTFGSCITMPWVSVRSSYFYGYAATCLFTHV
ncbi:hypothetical protein BT69DRAFT_1353782 [Atractiella rhizophila]|nr:hypothetical protein BT69DRAFT_1353782 [Atractiella rhizophila]